MTRLNTYWPANLHWVYSVVWIKHSKHSFVSFFLSFVLISFILVGGTGLEPVSHKAPDLQSGVLPVRLSSEDCLFKIANLYIWWTERESNSHYTDASRMFSHWTTSPYCYSAFTGAADRTRTCTPLGRSFWNSCVCHSIHDRID